MEAPVRFEEDPMEQAYKTGTRILALVLVAAFFQGDAFGDLNAIPEKAFQPNPILWLKPEASSRPLAENGRLDGEWPDGASFGGFSEYEPVENRKPAVDTRGTVAYDSQALDVAFVCGDPDLAKLRASLTDRGQMYQDDWVCVSIDPQGNHQAAYQFFVNPRGVQGDRLWQINGTVDQSHDLVFQSEARIQEGGWTAAMHIPFESLRFPGREDQHWLVHFTRHYPREHEYVYS